MSFVRRDVDGRDAFCNVEKQDELAAPRSLRYGAKRLQKLERTACSRLLVLALNSFE